MRSRLTELDVLTTNIKSYLRHNRVVLGKRENKCYEVCYKTHVLIRLQTVKQLRELKAFLGKETFDKLDVYEVQPFYFRG